MRLVVRALSATLVLLTGLLMLSSAAEAAVKGRIVSIQAKNGQLTVVFAAAGLDPAQTIDPKSVQLALDGTLLSARVQTGATATAATGVARRVVLAIDTSGSMAGTRIEAAKAAALAYLDRAPADVAIGLVTFSDTATSSVDPTPDRGVVRSAIGRLQAHGNTALYDAVQLAVQALGRSGDRSILLVSDGVDDGSRYSLGQAETALRTSKTSLNAVLIGGAGAQQALTALSEVAGGRVVSARAAADLTSAFVQAARDADKEVVLTAAIPEQYTGGEAPVYVAASAAGQQINDTAIAVNLVSSVKVAADPALFGPRAVAPVHGIFAHRTIMYAGLAALFLSGCVVLGTATSAFAGSQGQLTRRLLPYGRSARPQEEAPSTSVRDAAVGLADDLVRSRGLEEVLGRKLEAGAVPLRPAEWLLVHVGIALLLPLLGLLISDFNIAFTAICVVLGVLGPFVYLTLKESLRRRKFNAQLADTLQLLSGSLSAGYSLPQAVDAVVRQGAPPMADELRKALVEARLGAPIEDALDDIGVRMTSKDFSWVVMAIRIQRQVGGNLAEVLSTTAATLRERERLRRQVQVLSAEGRLSAYVLLGLPIFFTLYLLVARPAYLKPLFTDPIGVVMLMGMGILLVVGGFWMRKVVRVEV